jgi:pimeloyl-ACP methyl ester carboxylesterase
VSRPDDSDRVDGSLSGHGSSVHCARRARICRWPGRVASRRPAARLADVPRGSAVAVFWLHGSPNIGSPPEPLFAAAEASGLRWVSYDQPGYGGSGPHDGRTVAS